MIYQIVQALLMCLNGRLLIKMTDFKKQISTKLDFKPCSQNLNQKLISDSENLRLKFSITFGEQKSRAINDNLELLVTEPVNRRRFRDHDWHVPRSSVFRLFYYLTINQIETTIFVEIYSSMVS